MTNDMARVCECYQKIKYLENIHKLDNAEESEELQGSKVVGSKDTLAPRETAVKLPGVIRVNDSIFEYPNTQNMDLPLLFQQLTEIISGVNDYESNILSFWIIDVFLEGLRTAQLAGMSHTHQRATLHWMVYVYNMIQGNGTRLRRKDMSSKLKSLLLDTDHGESNSTSEIFDFNESEMSVSSINTPLKVWRVPFPPIWRDHSTESENSEEYGESRPATEYEVSTEPRTDEEWFDEDTEQNIHFMNIILEIIYRLYARLWPFILIQNAVYSTPTLEVVDLPFKLNVPKQVLKQDDYQTKSDRGGRKSASRIISDEACAGRELSRRDYILPLQVAEGADNLLRDLFSMPSQDQSITDKDRGKLDKKKK